MRKLTTRGKLFIASAAVSLLVIASLAHACTAFFRYEYVSGMNKICVYDHLGSQYAITIKSHQLCPINVQAPH